MEQESKHRHAVGMQSGELMKEMPSVRVQLSPASITSAAGIPSMKQFNFEGSEFEATNREASAFAESSSQGMSDESPSN